MEVFWVGFIACITRDFDHFKESSESIGDEICLELVLRELGQTPEASCVLLGTIEINLLEVFLEELDILFLVIVINQRPHQVAHLKEIAENLRIQDVFPRIKVFSELHEEDL